jgi:hypothetical protein
MKQKQEGACTVPDCKGKPSFGPILMPNDLAFKEAYSCGDCKDLLVRELIVRLIMSICRAEFWISRHIC